MVKIVRTGDLESWDSSWSNDGLVWDGYRETEEERERNYANGWFSANYYQHGGEFDCYDLDMIEPPQYDRIALDVGEVLPIVPWKSEDRRRS